MENNQEREAPASEKVKKGSMKWKVYLVLFLLLVGIFAYGYFWYEKTNTLRTEAVQVINRAEKFDVLLKAVNDEKARCEQFIAQKEGDFESFEYCKKFLDWSASRVD
jgi:flagellar basal body-associated protein FliL